MIAKAAIIGGGVIGAGWAARLIENGIDISVYDPAPDAEAKMAAVLSNADRAYVKLTMAARSIRGNLRYAKSIAEAVSDAQLIVESVPERLDIKHAVYADIEKAAFKDAFIASSTSGIIPSDLQANMDHPERLFVAHPFNPVYLLPVVEIVGGKKTSETVIVDVMNFYASIGMKPVHIRKEIEAFVADRLLESIWRESLWLISDGICTTQELDDIVRFGFGLRYAQMGVFETYRVAGGEAGMRHFMAQFGPCLKWPWSHMTDVPEFNDALVDLIADQSDAQSGQYSIRKLERIRDDNLIAIQQALKANGWGAGQVLADYEKKLFDAGARTEALIDFSKPVKTMERLVPPDWTDYNGHMNEARYLQCFADATDSFMRIIGVDADYIASGGSYFTVETHIRHLAEVSANQPVHVLTRLIEGKGKRMHLFHELRHADGTLLATGEHMLVHVSLKTRSASEPEAHVMKMLTDIAAQQAHLVVPEGLGRAIGQKA